ncbi:MAG: acylphosphatase [Nitrospirae bacterium]|nr:acylphosphatase [Nitrospirota bacterium]
MTKRVHIIVRGRVQGVNFRWATQVQARDAGLAGWVRNNPDRSVEIVAEGEESAVTRFTTWCRKGPPAARVTAIEVRDDPPTGAFLDFDVRYD